MPETPPVLDTPSLLTDTARAEVGRIADWCEGQRDHSEKMARAQIRMVWILLLLGLALLLVLPRVLHFIDYLGQDESLPPKVLASFGDTNVVIESNRLEIAQEVASAEESIAAVESGLADAKANVASIEADIRGALNRPFGVWRWPVPPDEIPRILVTSITQGKEFTWITGSTTRFELPDKKAAAAVIRMYDGDQFQVIPVLVDEEWVDQAFAILVLEPDSQYLLAVSKDDTSLLLNSMRLQDWESVWKEKGGDPAEVEAFASGSDGVVVLGGVSNITAFHPRQAFLMVSDDGRTWTPVDVPGADGKAGRIHDVIATKSGYFALGVLDAVDQFSMIFGHSSNGRDWKWENKLYSQRTLFAGALGSGDLAETSGEVVLAYVGGSLYQFDPASGGWSERETSLPSGIRTLIPLSTGAVLTATDVTDRNIRERVELEFLDADYPPVALEMDGQFLKGAVAAGVETGPGKVLLGGDGYLIESLQEADRQRFVNSVIKNARLPERSVVAVPLIDGTASRGAMAELIRSLNGARSATTGWEQRLDAQRTIRDAAQQTLVRQAKVKEDFAKLSGELEDALRQAEPIRQLAQIATRLAVIALLIYLVQIVVNRYRYLQRLAGFYQARAHALRLFAASPDAALLKGVSLADLTAMLSPDAIGFDKSAEPPTGQMVSLLQAGLRKG